MTSSNPGFSPLSDTIDALAALPDRLGRGLLALSARVGRTLAGTGEHRTTTSGSDRRSPVPDHGDTPMSIDLASEPPELTTSEILIAGKQPLTETGDPDRASRARRLASTYLARRQRKLREQLDSHR